MAEKWLTDTLLSIDELVRVERGPQIIELECNDDNLRDEITAPHYKIGGRDAYGRAIRPDEAHESVDTRLGVVKKGEQMAVVDWRAKHVPHVWKIYRFTEEEDHPDGGRFLPVAEIEGKDDAVERARELRGSM